MTFLSNQYRTSLPLFDVDDLFSLPNDIFPDEDFNNFTHFNDNNDNIEMILNDLDLSPENDQSQASLSSETLQCDLTCRVCGAPATGHNFDQVTCESCKAFFRRNALKHMPDMKCRFSGSCIINIHTRRQCTYCRLKKCFDIKMRKDWIRTEEETKLRQLQKLMKQERKRNKSGCDVLPAVNLPLVVRKKKRLMNKPFNILQPAFNGTYFGFHRNLDNEDNIWLNNIKHAYQIEADKIDRTFITKYTDNTTFSQFINDECSMHISLIMFFKQIPDFKRLHIDDQVHLIKSNFRTIIHLHHILVDNFEEPPQIGKHMSKWINVEFHEQMSRTYHRFNRFMKYPLLLNLALIVFLFSMNLSATHSSNEFDEYKTKKLLMKHQDFYTALLWRYLNYLFDENDAVLAMEIIVTQMLRYQLLMVILESHMRQMLKKEKFHELIETIFELNGQTEV
ncbi:hypothetical protein I4U23_001800 [Adineta vaga]|nr:hypothetical protein I4U23_001800 [Adineta vaga]